MISISALTSVTESVNGSKKILDSVNFELAEGEHIGIVGESGSGKSQFVLSITGLSTLHPGAIDGKIGFKGLEFSFNSTKKSKNDFFTAIRKEISFIFQDAKASLIPYQTIFDQGFDTWRRSGNTKDKILFKNRAIELLNMMNIANADIVLSSYPNQLSGGESQRAYIMLTMLGSPALIIADEPTSSLDPYSSKQLIELLKYVCLLNNTSLILITHDLSELFRTVSRVYVMYKGRVIEELKMSPNSATHQPLHPYTQFLFSMATGEAFRKLKNDDPDEDFEIPFISENNVGCSYFNHCKHKNTLPELVVQKCRDLSPPMFNQDGCKVACWSYEK